MKRTAMIFVLAMSFGFAIADEGNWTGSINLNASSTISTRNTQSIFIFGDAQRNFAKGRLGIKANYAFSRQDPGAGPSVTTEDRWSLSGQYDWNIGTKTFGYFSGRLDRDAIARLDLRTVFGAGLGTSLFGPSALNADGDWEWKVSAGASLVNENYRTGADNDYVGLQLGSNYRRILGGGWRFAHDLSFIPNVEDFDDYFYVSDLSVSKAIGSNWNIRLSYILDYDSTPAPGARRQNSKYALSLGYKF